MSGTGASRRLVAPGAALLLVMLALLAASQLVKAPPASDEAESRQTGSRQTGSRQTGSRQTGSRQTGSRQTVPVSPGVGAEGPGGAGPEHAESTPGGSDISDTKATSPTGDAKSPPGLLILHATIGRESASLDFIRRRPGPWRRASARPRAGAFPVLVLLLDEAGKERARVLVHVEGLIPEGTPAEALQNGELIIGDQAFSAAVPTLIKLPDLPPPLTLRIETLDGVQLGEAGLTAEGLARD